eukprot:7136376-Karenia_brevis.AAC.1
MDKARVPNLVTSATPVAPGYWFGALFAPNLFARLHDVERHLSYPGVSMRAAEHCCSAWSGLPS